MGSQHYRRKELLPLLKGQPTPLKKELLLCSKGGWRKGHFVGTGVKFTNIIGFYQNALAEIPFRKTFIGKILYFKLGLLFLLTGKKCICMKPSWLIVIYNNRITLMDVFKYECSNFMSNKWYIIVFQTPCRQNICSWSRKKQVLWINYKLFCS